MTDDAFFLVIDVLMVKLAEFDPAGTSTLAGTLATAGFDDARATLSPPAGAAWVSVTVPVEDVPPNTVPGLSDRLDKAAAGTGFTAKVVVRVTPS